MSLLAMLSIGSHFGVSQMDISPEQFNQWNSITALLYCVLTPLACGLGVVGLLLKNDSKTFSGMALLVVTIPFLFFAFQLFSSLIN